MPITLPTVFTVGGRPEYPALIHKTEEEREIARIINNILAGKMNCIGDFTLLADTTELVVLDDRVNPFSAITILPVDDVAAGMLAYAVPGDKEFTVKAGIVASMWAGMVKDVPEDYVSDPGVPTKIANYLGPSDQSFYVSAITPDPVAGTFTLNFDGAYQFDFRTSFEPAPNRDYSWWVSRDGIFDAANAAKIQSKLVGGGMTAEAQISVGAFFSLSAGTVVAAYIEDMSMGMFSDTVFSAFFGVKYVGGPVPISAVVDADYRYSVLG